MSASAAQGGHIKTRFWATVTSNGSPYATGPLSCLSVCQSVCLSVTLVYCGQTVGWVKMPLGTETGLGPGDIVLDGDQLPPRKGSQQPPLFVPCLLWPNGWMDRGTPWYGGRLQPWQHCVRWEFTNRTEKGTAAPTCRAMSIEGKRLQLLSSC